jgi:UDP-galactopyranose mutase
VEYKHFDQLTTENTVISREYPQNYSEGSEKYYPINTPQNAAILHKYMSLIDKTKFIFGGRLAEYKYYDMHQVIASAMHKYRNVTL